MDDLLTDRIDWRVRYLRKQLMEIVKQRKLLVGKHRKRGIITHCCDRLCSILCHWKNCCLKLLVGITKCFLQTASLLVGKLRHTLIWNWNIGQICQIAVEPFTIWLCICILIFQLIIRDQLSCLRIARSILPGRKRSFITTCSGSISKTPTSEERIR